MKGEATAHMSGVPYRLLTPHTGAQGARLPVSEHPVIRTHPVTRRKVLYGYEHVDERTRIIYRSLEYRGLRGCGMRLPD